MNGQRTPELDARIIELRGELGRTRMSCSDISLELGIPVHQVWACLRRNGLTGDRIQSRRRAAAVRQIPHGKTGSLVRSVLDRFDSITIERGATGGFIVTLDDEWTGVECDSISKAIRSAEQVA